MVLIFLKLNSGHLLIPFISQWTSFKTNTAKNLNWTEDENKLKNKLVFELDVG